MSVTFSSFQLSACGLCLQGYVSKLDEVAGTFAWAAPELLMGGRCSEKVDIFSFGVVLWELATTERPQRGAMRDVRCASCCALQPALSEHSQAWRRGCVNSAS